MVSLRNRHCFACGCELDPDRGEIRVGILVIHPDLEVLATTLVDLRDSTESKLYRVVLPEGLANQTYNVKLKWILN